MGTRMRLRIDVLAAITVLCLVAAVLFVDAAVATEQGWSATGVTQITATVRTTIDVDFADDHLVVKANTPWQVSADLPNGERWTASGGPTGGLQVVLPEGAAGVEVCAL